MTIQHNILPDRQSVSDWGKHEWARNRKIEMNKPNTSRIIEGCLLPKGHRIAPISSNAPIAPGIDQVLTGRSTPILFQERVNSCGNKNKNKWAEGPVSGRSDENMGAAYQKAPLYPIRLRWHNSVPSSCHRAPMRAIAPPVLRNRPVLTPGFHPDPGKPGQGECRPLETRLRRGKQKTK